MNPIETVKRVPPMVWLIGGAVVVGVIVLKSGAGSSSGPSGVSSSGGGGGGTAGVDEVESLAQGFTDLAAQVQQQIAEDAAWKQQIQDQVNKASPTGSGATSTVGANVIKHTVSGDVPAAIRSKYSATSLDQLFIKGKLSYGTAINLSDLKRLLKKEHINYGSTVDVKDIAALFKKTGVKPTAPTPAPTTPTTTP